MRYVQLRAFHHVALAGGFTRAAEALKLTQPAVSDQVRRLEAEYDVRLFNRSGRQVSLTEAGSRLLEITRRLFDVEDQAFALLSETRSVRSGRLAIVADAAHHIAAILQRFRARNPAVSVSIAIGNTEEVLGRLRDYSADIGVLGELPDSAEHDTIQLSSAPLVAFAPNIQPFAAMDTIAFNRLADLPLILREKGSKTRGKLESHARDLGLDLNVQIEAEGREAVRELVAAGSGVGVVSDAEYVEDPRLKRIPISDASLTMDEAVICLRERRESRLIRAFMEIARETAR